MRFVGYRLVAPFYETMRNFFFPSISKAQREFHRLDPKLVTKIAVVGGGSGDILYPLLQKFKNATIYFIEPSEAMMEKARERFGTSRRIFFKEENMEDINLEDIDVMILPFVLDIIPERKMKAVAKSVIVSVKHKGFILFSDFVQKQDAFSKLKTFILYLIFLPFRGKLQMSLPDYNLFFDSFKHKLVNEKNFSNKTVTSRLYQVYKD